MKKSLFLGLALAMLSSSALAYTNSYAGYSIKNEANLQNAVEAARFYAYTSYPQAKATKAVQGHSVHVAGYFTAAEMEKITGEPFTTAYFNQQYENLALLGRCELDLRTVPVAMLDLANYGAVQEQNVYARLLTPVKELQAEEILAKEKAKLEEAKAAEAAEAPLTEEAEAAAIEKELAAQAKAKQEDFFEPWVRVDEIGKHRVITISQYYRQLDKRTEHIIVAHTSLLSKNDKMYVLTTYNYETLTPEDKKLEHKYFKKSVKDRFPELEELQNEKLEPFAPKKKEKLNEKFSAELWQEHKDFVGSFKYVEPQATTAQVAFYDPLVGKSFTLPEDWFYVQLRPEKNREQQDNLVLAASYPQFIKLLDQESSTRVAAELERLLQLVSSEGSPLLKLDEADALRLAANLEEMLISGSFTMEEDQELAAILARPEESKEEFELFLRGGMDRLHSMENGLYLIHGYGYETEFTPKQALADLDVHTRLLDKYELINRVRFACQKDKGLLFWYSKKENLPNNTEIVEQIDQWQF